MATAGLGLIMSQDDIHCVLNNFNPTESTQLMKLSQCKPLEKEFVNSLASALGGMDPKSVVKMMFRMHTSPRKPVNLKHIHVVINGIHIGRSKVEDLIAKYQIGSKKISHSPPLRPRGSVHVRTGRTAGARGFGQWRT
jgi:hypothetical protein